jgi:C-terminal processing protease CtpA/Prc
MSNARFFGDKTNGLTSANDIYPLSDGADLVLAVADETDRNGHSFSDGIHPDEQVSSDWERVGTEADPVVRRAIRWISATHSTAAKPAQR